MSVQRDRDGEADASFVRDKQIRFHHCDPAGIVFYPQYFVLFNELVEDWFRVELDLSFARMHLEARLGIPMVHIECDFLAPSSVGEVLTFRLRVTRLGGSSMDLDVVAEDAEARVRVRARLTVAQISLDTRRSVPLDDALRARIERFRTPAGGA